MNLNTGHVGVVFDSGATVPAAKLWKAVDAGGFTPVRIEMDDKVYEGPAP